MGTTTTPRRVHPRNAATLARVRGPEQDAITFGDRSRVKFAGELDSNAAAGGDKQTAEGFLKAFIKEVNTQTGKHISGAAPQLLLTDANRLLDQLQ